MKNIEKFKAAIEKYPEEFETFKDMFQHTLHWEGGGKLHKVKGDSGGWTIWGVAYNYNKHLFESLEDFKDTTYSEAAMIAFVKYYLKIEAYRVPMEARLMYFDMAYNMGTNRAIKYMQKCIGVGADGKIGPVTRSKMHLCREECLHRRRNNFYYWLAKNRKGMSKFLKGWLRRSNAIKDL